MTIPVGYSQVNLKFTGTLYPTGAEVTYGIEDNGSVSPENTAEAIGDIWAAANLAPRMTDGCDLVAILVKQGPDATGASAEIGYSIAGTGSGDGSPPNTAILVRKVTELGGRAGRGRMFMPGVSETDAQGGGNLDSEERSNWQTVLDEVLAEHATAEIPWVVLHGAGSPLSTPTPIVALTVDSRLATQRRRLRR